MARPREFDEASALDAAMDCFWRDGYEATSVRDLAARMGITGASLYNAFGDKRSLFRAVLQRYAERSTRERIARLESTFPPKQAMRAFLGNTALEIAPHLVEWVRAHLAEFRAPEGSAPRPSGTGGLQTHRWRGQSRANRSLKPEIPC
jgi:AcrR family transcriptional regulator